MIHKENSDWLLPALLSTTAGAVDVIGFLALGGLFTAHITGNLVVLAAHYITGHFGQIAPLLSVPMFMVVLGIVTLTFGRKPIRIARRTLLVLQALLLACFLGFGTGFGPFPDPNNGMAVFVGMLWRSGNGNSEWTREVSAAWRANDGCYDYECYSTNG